MNEFLKNAEFLNWIFKSFGQTFSINPFDINDVLYYITY